MSYQFYILLGLLLRVIVIIVWNVISYFARSCNLTCITCINKESCPNAAPSINYCMCFVERKRCSGVSILSINSSCWALLSLNTRPLVLLIPKSGEEFQLMYIRQDKPLRRYTTVMVNLKWHRELNVQTSLEFNAVKYSLCLKSNRVVFSPRPMYNTYIPTTHPTRGTW